jgi:tricorn protease interacting factor F2/3
LEVLSYDLDLDVRFQSASVRGLAVATVRDVRGDLTLDASAMEVEGVRVGKKEARFIHDRAAGRLTIKGVPKGRASVKVAFTKKVSDKVIFGLYKSKYGREYLLVTDLEPAEARTVFPCVDDPAYKAVFRLSVTTEAGLRVLANSREKSSRKVAGGRVRHVFEPTPRMSTYLFFMGIGRFEEAKERAGNKQVIVATRPGQLPNAKFTLDATRDYLLDYEKYFGVKFPLKKLHVIALPEYHTGAMENWGAITTREGLALFDANSGVADLRHGAAVTAHEIAHQWFGDLVTMKWWDNLWLNESFATFMEYKVDSRLHPDWDPLSSFLRTSTFRSQNLDALTTTHPIEVEVRTPEECAQVFDGISYGKGASVLRMIETYIGDEPFRKGVSAYLRKHGYSNATGKDLWRSLGRASRQPVSKIMGAWVRKPGFPLVRLSRSGDEIKLTQSRFQLDGREPADVWPIPLTMELNGKRKNVLFDKKSMTMKAPGLRKLNVNVAHSGFYSVLCEPEVYEEIARGFRSLSQYDKGGLLCDLYLFLQAEKVTPAQYFRFVSLSAHESDPMVIQTVAEQLTALYSIAEKSETLRDVAVEFAVSQMHRLGFSRRKGESEMQSTLREAVSVLLARLDTEHTARLAAMFSDFDSVDPNLKEAVAIAYARLGGAAAHQTLTTMVKSTESEVDRSRLYAALASFKEPELQERTLELGISGEVSRSDNGYTLGMTAANPDARDTLWSWIQRRYDRLWELYAGSQQIMLYMEGMVPRCAVGKVDEVRAFFGGDKMEKGGMVYRRMIEEVEVRTRLRDVVLSADGANPPGRQR